MSRTETQINAYTELERIRWLSKCNRRQEFHSLMHHINVTSLSACFNKLEGKKAAGADQITKEDYGANLQENLEELIKRMKSMSYRPGPARQVLIPKEGKGNAKRALGIGNFEDKLVQKRMQEILESIYDPIFLDCVYGFRENRSCHKAIKELQNYLYREEVEVVIDVDLENFFGTIDHKILEKMLSMKIKDPKFLRYINRMFKSGILVGKELTISDEGLPQGSCVSPVLANIYAHYVIDNWLEETVKPKIKGLKMFRYADDLVVCCKEEKEALRFKEALTERLTKFKLKLNEEKTKMVKFSKRKQQRGEKQGAFDFLGFTFYLGKSRQGRTIPKLKTSGKRICSKLKKVNEWVKKVKNLAPLKTIWKVFCAKIRGHFQYYGVSSNTRGINIFLRKAVRIMYKWLNRRSQRRSFCWNKFNLFILRHPLPKIKIYHKLFEV